MRNMFTPGRSNVFARNAMAATSHPLATSTANDILRRGGNAVDAGIAACAVLAVVEPQMTGIGGDCFALLAKRGVEPILAFNGSGRSASTASAETLRNAGLSQIAADSVHSVTVPGAIDAWFQMSRDHGTMSFADLLTPAADIATNGHPLHERIVFDIESNLDKVRKAAGFADLILKNGNVPPVGFMYRNEALGRTLSDIAKGGPEAFYKGRPAKEIVSFLARGGGQLTTDDFASHRGEYVQPIAADYRGFKLHQCPPNGQGVITLLLMQLLSKLNIGELDPNGFDRVHLMTELARIAFSIRDAWLGDPDWPGKTCSWESFLDSRFTEEWTNKVKLDRVLDIDPAWDLPRHKDTVYLTVVDKERNSFSLINSIFEPFGSGLYEPETGILLQNRGKSFSLADGHPNSLAPSKRPMHTIIPGMVTQNGRVAYSYGVMGGHFQPVGHAILLSNIIDFGMDLQGAVDAPRWFPQDNKLMVEPTLSEAVLSRLKAVGHDVVVRRDPIGGAQIIGIDWDESFLFAASDPRKDGCALGF